VEAIDPEQDHRHRQGGGSASQGCNPSRVAGVADAENNRRSGSRGESSLVSRALTLTRRS
jgi:hypothetical protein